MKIGFEELTPQEIDNVRQLVPFQVQAQMREAGDSLVLAGGAIRDTVAGLPVKDIDIFCNNDEQAAILANSVSPYAKKTLFAYTVDLITPVQYVFYKAFADAYDLIGQFDFRACCAGIYWDQTERRFVGIAVEGFHADVRDKRLMFMSQEKDAGKLTALGRALHLAARGWTLSTDEAANIIVHWGVGKDLQETRHAFRPHYGRV